MDPGGAEWSHLCSVLMRRQIGAGPIRTDDVIFKEQQEASQTKTLNHQDVALVTNARTSGPNVSTSVITSPSWRTDEDDDEDVQPPSAWLPWPLRVQLELAARPC